MHYTVLTSSYAQLGVFKPKQSIASWHCYSCFYANTIIVHMCLVASHVVLCTHTHTVDEVDVREENVDLCLGGGKVQVPGLGGVPWPREVQVCFEL